jgi:translocation and assembly module TamA
MSGFGVRRAKGALDFVNIKTALIVFAVADLLIVSASQAQSTTTDPFDDPAFNASLPPLEPVLPAPTTPPAPPPADPELSAPLPALATSNTVPEQTVVVQDEKPSKVRYRVELKGLKDIGLEQEFRSASALFNGNQSSGLLRTVLGGLLGRETSADNAAQVDARAQEDTALAVRLMKADGYYDALATADVGPVADADGQLPVVITAAPGLRYNFGTIAVTGTPPEPQRYALEALALKTGNPIVAVEVTSAEARVALRLPELGYPFVTVGQRDIVLDDATHVGDYSLPVEAGPKARFGGFRTVGDPVFDVRHISIFPRFKQGDLYDSRKTDDLRQALVATSLFTTIAIEPVRTGNVAADGTEAVDLVVRQVKGPARSLSASAGYATGEGIKLEGAWTHRNLFSPEGALTLAAVAGTQEQSVSTLFRRSNAGKRDRAFQAGLSVARQRFDAYDANTINLNASLSRVSTPIWQKRWTYSVGAELIATRENRFDATLAERADNTYFIAALPLQLGYDRSDNLLDPTRGFRLTARVSPEIQQRSGGGKDAYARTLFEGSAYYGIGNSIVLAGRARVGSIVGAARDAIAPSRRLYSGGGGSVRGFGYQQLGPKDIDDNPIGGRSVTEFALEARYRFGVFGVVPFIDAGRVGESSSPSLSGLRYGVGIGGRYYTNFGPLRLDVATPLGRRSGEPTVAVYLSIGQAF